jgi:uncharacterized protein (DUF302 family)
MKVLLVLFVGALSFVLASGWNSAAPAPESSADYTRSTDRPLADVLAAVQEAAKTHGFKVSGTHDLQASLKKEGIERGPYTVVEICRADLASEVLKAEPRFGSLMPCALAVYQQGGRAVVSTVLPTRLLALFPGAKVQAQAAQVDEVLKSIVNAATSPQSGGNARRQGSS